MTDTIFLLENLVDIEKLKKESSKPNSKIFSLNYQSHHILKKNNMPHFIGEDVLTKEDMKLIDKQAIDTTINWYNTSSIINHTTYQKILLPTLIEVEILLYFSSILRSIFTIHKIIQQEQPKTIISSTRVNDFIQNYSKNEKINFKILHGNEKLPSFVFDKLNIKFNLFSIPVSLNIPRNRYLKIKKIIDSLTYSFFKLKPNKEFLTKKLLLLLDFNPVSYSEFINELSDINTPVLLLNQRRPAIFNKSSLEILRKSKCKIINLNQFETKNKTKISREQKKVKDSLNKLWMMDSYFEDFFSYNSISYWSSIKKPFMNMCNSRFSEAIKRIIIINELFDNYNINLILEWAEAGQEEKEVLSIAKQRGISSMMLQHAMYPSTDVWDPFARFLAYFSHPLMSDMQALWGKNMEKYALSHGFNKKNLIITGSPRHDKFFNFKKVVKNEKTILFATTGPSEVATEFSTTNARLNYEEYVKKVVLISKKFPEKKLIVKTHPHTELMFPDVELIKEIDPNIPIIVDANLTELISSCDILITINNSTIALESIILGKPTISLQCEDWCEDEDIVKSEAILSIRNPDDLEAGISKLLYDENYVNQLKNNAQKFIQQYLANGGSASKSLAKAIENIIEANIK